MQKKIIILLGAPGSGKGTQAKLLAQTLGYTHISTGDLLRSLVSKEAETEEEKTIQTTMQAGKLVSDTLIYRLAFAAIQRSLSQGKGVVLDGAIRSVTQAEAYQHFFEEEGVDDACIAVEIAISDEESFHRLTKRKVCATCGNIVPFSPGTADMNACPKCQGTLIVRKDDNPETIAKRIQEQGNSMVRPIASYYEQRGLLRRIDGTKTIENVQKDILSVLSQ
ncbi:MAG TPA: nucleoside monophosphate kinase [Candidatus Kapabacteria bacterium]|nr:nucleoside monophosphate kinase [Candidatus Kapabacteria bacterium]